MKVYVVAFKYFTRTEIEGVFSTEEKAKTYIAEQEHPEEFKYEEFEIDKYFKNMTTGS